LIRVICVKWAFLKLRTAIRSFLTN
jgi:hypothetical protein